MRLLDRNDTSLALALLVSALVIWLKPLGVVMDAARRVDVRYDVDLLEGLAVLVAAVIFTQYRTRQQARSAELVAAAEAARERQRTTELEQLVAFGTALGASLDGKTLRQTFWRYMSAFARNRPLWLLVRENEEWQAATRDATTTDGRDVPALLGVAKAALAWSGAGDARAQGVAIGDDICFPMAFGAHRLGVVGIVNEPELTAAERRVIGAAVELFAGALRNVQLMTQLKDNSVRDPLTRCFNRAYALEALATELLRAKRSGQPVAVMMFDVDRFKRMNDEHGHLIGDTVLEAVGMQMIRTLRASDVKCRWGGDEFLVILPETSLSGAEHAAGSLTREVADIAIPTSIGAVSPTISVGLAVGESGEVDPKTIIARADEALYKAKQAGRNRFVVARSLRIAVTSAS
jgi:diguanylate cyclase (GGDEF)-like protein